MKASRDDVLRYRVHTQQLDRAAGTADDAAVLDLGVQDTGPDGSRWALAIRGTRVDDTKLVTAWTLRGAPHVYRRAEAAKVAAAVAPMTEADARKRVFDALDEIAGQMRDIVTEPISKGDVSTALTPRMPEPYRRFCKSCNAVHLYEQTFRLAAIRAGLELRPGTSPPVLERIPGWRGPAAKVPAHLDPIRAVLHHLGPLTPKQVAAYLDSPVKDVSAHWPDDAVDVEVDGEVDGETRSMLADDVDELSTPPEARDVVRLLGPFDPYLQCRDRELLVPDESRRKDIWRTLGRPGSVLVGHEIRGTWRPKMSGGKLRLAVEAWDALPDIDEQAEALAAHRGVTFTGFVDP